MKLSKMGMRTTMEMGFKFWIKSLGVPFKVMPAATVPKLPSIWE